MQHKGATITEKRIAELEKQLKEFGRELEIQASLEMVRIIALAMKKPGDMPDVCRAISQQLESLGVKEIRNVQTAIIYSEKGTYMDYGYFTKHDKCFINEVAYTDHPLASIFADHMMKGNGEIFITHMKGKQVKDWLNYQKGKNVFIDTWLETATSLNFYWYPLGPVALGISTYAPLNENEIQLFKRFRNVFELAYRRYLDIERAEAQAREGQIQLALERVRARTMAMQKSSELSETAYVLFQQFKQLGEVPAQITIGIFNEQERSIEFSITGANGTGDKIEQAFNLSIEEPTLLRKMYAAWKEQKKSIVLGISGQDLLDWIKYRSEKSGITDSGPATDIAGHRYICAGFFSKGLLTFSSKELISGETVLILERFAAVFDQTYARFLDLQKAEAQTREAQIQLAMERVRAKTMSMQKPCEFVDVINVIGQQFIHLGFDFDWVNFSANGLDVSKAIDIWNFVAVPGLYQGATRLVIPFIEHPIFAKAEQSVNEYYRSGNNFTVVLLDKKDKDSFLDHLFTNTIYKDLPEEAKKSQYEREVYQTSNVVLKDTWLSLGKFDVTPLTEEQIAILKRLANEFGQAYTRYLDLQKAEAQAREAEIELALERVRARTMAMQHSEELQEVVHTVLERLKELNVDFYTAIIILFTEGSKDIIWWLENKEKQQYSKILIPYTDIEYWRDLFTIRENGINHFSKSYSSEEKYELYHHLFEHTDFKYVPEKQKKFLLEAKSATFSVAIAKNSGIHLTRYSDIAFSEKDNDILMRFAGVFEQSYTRFLDLQKAEVQAREAQIEASLERVRGKAMAMHNSNDVSAAASMVFTELRKLGIDPIRCGVGLLNKESRKALLYSDTSTSNEDSLSLIGWVILSGHPVLEDIYGNWLKQEDYYPELTGTQLESYYKNLLAGLSLPSVPNWKTGEKQYGHFFSFSVGCLYAWSDRHYNQLQIKILKRFAGIIDLTFRRFLDLQKAEAQAREAQIETALEKVRSRTLAMQRSDELADTSAVLFKQLIHLGIAPNRLYIGIIHDKSGEIEFWITDEDGSKVSSKFTGNAFNNPSIKKMYDGWAEQRKWLIIDMHGKELREYFHYLGDELRVPFKGGLSQKRRIQYLTYFSKGFIGMASPDEQPNETVNLLERFAYVFNLTFTRFNDLQIAEAHALQAEQDLIEIKAARKRAEDTLTELQETQRQLIQSEKMASLGELTAGIAHEIQNPLNFVNNFSDVSNELVDEMNEELDKGEVQEARLIAADLKQNLEKINHHGKRADAIVKGMLQHSRKSSGQKEPTDINTLADEYLRLSYHGLRAKDKNFNATIETDFDNSIGKVPLIPQDIGRVLLNLFNNAFYAVNEQKSKNCILFSTEVPPLEKESPLCEPTVSVSTKKSENHLIITVKDNGGGIPQKILDKIFQPFFTTKPTGQGTGLGLSLSYDIIKAHGGEIKVESKQGEGSTFIIQLPILIT